MPTYEYECTGCGERFEIFQKITEKPLTRCRLCNGRVRRLISAGVGLIFKGSGFYITDYRSENYRKREKEDKPKIESAPKTGAGDGAGTKNKK